MIPPIMPITIIVNTHTCDKKIINLTISNITMNNTGPENVNNKERFDTLLLNIGLLRII